MAGCEFESKGRAVLAREMGLCYTVGMKKALNVVAAIFIENGKVMAAQRGVAKYDYLSHKYEFVGGKIEAGESPEAALKRELMEELHLDVRVDAHFLTVEHSYTDFDITLHTYLCTRESEMEVLEHECVDWLDIGELDASQWAGADCLVLDELKRRDAQGGVL